jgi:SAM-dependent methyltransferase
MGSQEFTGERFVPGAGGCEIAYEHIHRYLYASRWAGDKSVLDIASGEGYGTALLAEVAARVWGTDIDRATLEQARGAYRRKNLEFFQADAARLPFLRGSIDLVVAFEVLEHLPDQDEMVREIARVVLPGGVAIISTPDKAVYTDARGYSNPFHLHEFYEGEFLSLLRKHFPRITLLRQRIRAGSLILSDATSGALSEIIGWKAPDDSAAPVPPMYMIAVCAGESGIAGPVDSAYLDPTDGFILELRAQVERLGSWGQHLEEVVRERDESLRRAMVTLDEETCLRDGIIRGLQQEIGRRDEELIRLQREFEDRSRWTQALKEDVSLRDRQLEHANSELQKVGDHLARIRHDFLYRVLCRLRLLPK